MGCLVIYLLGVITIATFTNTADLKVKNLALYGKACQSSLVENPYAPLGHPSNAIDGNTDANFERGSCSHTASQQNPWWRVDLLEEYTITSITITNRDYLSERLNGAKIHVGNCITNNGFDNPQ
uniref:Fucolectin tachylectin-4 pentraxin-1 domain-containing protein n=1 Tax=Astyanax mexicanus TaxID=7994 RepID=A0A3B1IMM3_ASTMX